LSFPGRVTHWDNNGAAFFMTTVNHTTYQTVRAILRQKVSEPQHGKFLDEKARLFMTDERYDGMTKQMVDSVIGGSDGRFITMGRTTDLSKPLFVFIFLTIRDANFYMIRCSSSKPEKNAHEDARQFYGGVIFQRM
jgi:hypothetical protein